MFEKNDEDVIIMETSLKPGYHMALECVPVPKEIGDLAPIYFKVSCYHFLMRFHRFVYLFSESSHGSWTGMGSKQKSGRS